MKTDNLEPGTSTESCESRMITKLTPSIIFMDSEWDSVVQYRTGQKEKAACSDVYTKESPLKPQKN